MAVSPNTRLSNNFFVKDLTVTNTGLPNNLPESYLSNLRALANTLELLKEIDNFTINSGFRTSAVNAAVGGSNGSYHMEALAADLVPARLTPEQFWNKIHNTPRYRNAVGEYILYPNSRVHVSAPTAQKQGFDLIMNEAGQIVRSGIAYAQGNPATTAITVVGFGVLLFTIYQMRKYGQQRQLSPV